MGKKSTEVKFQTHHDVKSMCYQYDMTVDGDLDHLSGVYQVSLLSSSFYTVLLERKSLCVAHTGRLVSPTCLRSTYNCLEFSYMGDLFIFLHLFIQSLIYISMDS